MQPYEDKMPTVAIPKTAAAALGHRIVWEERVQLLTVMLTEDFMSTCKALPPLIERIVWQSFQLTSIDNL
jgi:hypothetical protein